VGPSGILGREPIEHRHQIVEHRRIGVLLERDGVKLNRFGIPKSACF
jgi:hypothetical protein